MANCYIHYITLILEVETPLGMILEKQNLEFQSS